MDENLRRRLDHIQTILLIISLTLVIISVSLGFLVWSLK